MVPIPRFPDYAAFNGWLASCCVRRQSDHVRDQKGTIGERFIADKAAFMALPAVAFEPCDKRATKVSSTSLVRYRDNDYSVPVRYGYRDVLVKGFVDEIVICADNDVIARHVPVTCGFRCYRAQHSNMIVPIIPI